MDKPGDKDFQSIKGCTHYFLTIGFTTAIHFNRIQLDTPVNYILVGVAEAKHQ